MTAARVHVPASRHVRTRVHARAEVAVGSRRRALWSSLSLAGLCLMTGPGWAGEAVEDPRAEAEAEAVSAALARRQYCLRRRGVARCRGKDGPCSQLESLAEEEGDAQQRRKFGAKALKRERKQERKQAQT